MRKTRATALGLLLLAAAGTPAAGTPAAAASRTAASRTAGTSFGLPWEIWDDPRQLPRLDLDHQVLLQGSRCPWGCRFDRHSAGDSRFIRRDGDEGVIFEELGAGAITRIWMTMSEPFDPTLRLRVYLDGEDEPRVDLPLLDLFTGNTGAPFLPPLVGDRTTSSGGFFSYVPIPYRQGCRVSLVGAEEARIWFQLTYHRLRDGEAVRTFTGDEDLSRWRELLAAPGADPWPEAEAEISQGELTLLPGESVTFHDADGPGLVTGLRLVAPEEAWDELMIRLTFDGQTTVDLPLADFFAYGRVGELPAGRLPTRSLLVGVDDKERLFNYFPMPFFDGVSARLGYSAAGDGPRTVGYWLRRSALPPLPLAGHFGAWRHIVDDSTPGPELPLLDLEGAGKWVGLFAELGSVDTPRRIYLEGDERIYLDGARHPALHGTGTEDLFNAGFFFDQGPFRQALHGMSYQFPLPPGDLTAAYRLFLTDAVLFGARIRARLETGPLGDLPMRARVVSYYYLRRSPALARADVLDLGDPRSIAEHQATVSGEVAVETLTAKFESEPKLDFEATGLYRQAGDLSFTFSTAGCLGAPRLRRLLDACGGVDDACRACTPEDECGREIPPHGCDACGESCGVLDGACGGGQAAVVRTGSSEAAVLPPIDPNGCRRFREIDVDLMVPIGGETAELTVAYGSGALPPATVGTTMSEFRYELWCLMDTLVFADGFESGDVSGW